MPFLKVLQLYNPFNCCHGNVSLVCPDCFTLQKPEVWILGNTELTSHNLFENYIWPQCFTVAAASPARCVSTLDSAFQASTLLSWCCHHPLHSVLTSPSIPKNLKKSLHIMKYFGGKLLHLWMKRCRERLWRGKNHISLKRRSKQGSLGWRREWRVRAWIYIQWQ